MELNALEKYELEELEASEVLKDESHGWKIDSLESADWAFRKIAALKKANKEIYQLADKERERIAEWETKETQSNQDSIDFFEHKLADYLRELRKNDPKVKIKTPHGTVSTRKQADLWEYRADAVDTLKKLGLTEFIKVTETVNKADFKKAVQVLEDGRVISPDGELIECVKVIPQGEKVIVKEG